MIKSLALALAMLATPALADGIGPVTYYFPGDAVDGRACIFFQTNNGPAWYAFSKDDWAAAYKFTQVVTSYASNGTLSFGTSGTVCGLPQAYDLALGTAH